MTLPAFKDYLAMSPEERAPHAEGFAKLNVVPPLDLRAQFDREGWQACEACGGEGSYLYEPIDPNAYAKDLICEDCDGSGQTKMEFFDWLETLD